VTLKNASLLALIGASLSALFTLYSLFSSLAGMAQGVLPPMILFYGLVHTFSWTALAVFLYVYYNSQK
jgi:hypothetical protein